VNGARPLLCLVTDRRASRRPLVEAVAAAVAAGVDWVQIREKDLGGGELLALADEIAAAARRASPAVRVLVNRRIDVALAAGLDGVHLGFDAPPPAVARRLLGADRLVGAATHAPGELGPDALPHLSYAHLAPVFAPLSKPAGRAPLGTAALSGAPLPLFAQGGVEASNAGACVRAGAAGVAVTGAILAAPDPAAAAAALRAALDHAFAQAAPAPLPAHR
jgi:thiamine-phosphate pyrophosphorylase